MVTTYGTGYFDFWILDSDGQTIGSPRRINTETALILNCHHLCDVKQVRHIAEMAYQHPGYPYDLSAWFGEKPSQYLGWSARIYWRNSSA